MWDEVEIKGNIVFNFYKNPHLEGIPLLSFLKISKICFKKKVGENTGRFMEGCSFCAAINHCAWGGSHSDTILNKNLQLVYVHIYSEMSPSIAQQKANHVHVKHSII